MTLNNNLNIEALLKKIELINYKYSLLNSKKFNLFEILRNKTDEVNLHSKFIVEILRNNSHHTFGKEITSSFIEILGIKNEFDIENYSVHKEYKDIDIFIKNKTQAIIIENKIYAGDQPKQLERYYDLIKEKNFTDIFIFYLTPYGKEPSENSLGKLQISNGEKIQPGTVCLISYEFHISEWIEKCIGIAVKNAPMREALIQYQEIINEITGKSTNMEQRKEIYNLLSKNNNIVNAYTIANNWKHIKWHTEWDFWLCLEKKIKEKNYHILDNQKFSAKKLNSVIHQSRNRNPWFGIKFELSDFKGEKVYLMVQRGFGEVIFGLKTSECNVEELSNALISYSDFKKDKIWSFYKPLSPKINFELFNEEDTLELCNKEKREKRVDLYWDQIFNLIKYYENEVNKK